MQASLAIDQVEAKKGGQVLAHCGVCVGTLDTRPAAEALLSLTFQVAGGFCETGFPDLSGAVMGNVLYGMS